MAIKDDPLFDLAIITCKSTYNRVAGLLRNLHSLTNTGTLRHIYIVLQSDVGFINDEVFDEIHWDDHISKIAPILALNIRECLGINHGSLLSLIDHSSTIHFPSRLLKPSERSLVWKHYNALTKVSELPILVLEDDAEFNEACLLDLCISARIALEKSLFVDLGIMPGMSSRGTRLVQNQFSYSMQLIACTRTTVASMWPPLIAQKIVESYWPCSLPADLHHQYLLSKLRVPGIWPTQSIFNHLSMPSSGRYASSIQN